MKKLIVILVLSLLQLSATVAQSSDKATSKLQKLSAKNPEKCIQYAKKLVSKRDNRKIAYYYLAISYHSLYTDNQRTSSLNNSIRYLGEFYKLVKDKDEIQDEIAIDGIKASIEDQVISNLDKRKFRGAAKYAKKYLRLFGDSLKQYATIEAELEALRYKSVVTTTQTPTSSSKTKQQRVNGVKLMSCAVGLVGTRYRYGGESKGGMDCSGFNVYVYRQSGVSIPHNAKKQSLLGDYVSRANCKPGDLIFFGSGSGSSARVNHTGMIYSNFDGKLKIVHCPNRGVIIEGEGDPSWDMYWEKRFLFIKRIINNDLADF